MELGIRQARKMIMSGLGLPDSNTSNSAQDLEAKPFERNIQVDELSIAWILYVLSATHEFDELPVRHNEELLNQEMSKGLMWGPDTKCLLSGNLQKQSHNLDIFADPHTKYVHSVYKENIACLKVLWPLTLQSLASVRCFLLLQAHLEHAKLPISDYVNDTKSVLDQVPRLLAAMQFIAEQDGTVVGSFEALCQFSRTRQLLETRMKVRRAVCVSF
jgi:hypothetical protein